MNKLKLVSLFLVCAWIIAACDVYQYDSVGQLPRDSGGALTMVNASSTDYGYYV